MPLLIEALADLDKELYVVCEQDMYGCPKDYPLPNAIATREYLGLVLGECRARRLQLAHLGDRHVPPGRSGRVGSGEVGLDVEDRRVVALDGLGVVGPELLNAAAAQHIRAPGGGIRGQVERHRGAVEPTRKAPTAHAVLGAEPLRPP